MIDKLFTEHPYIATWLVLELIFAISLFGWALASSETIADLMVPNFVIPSVVCTAISLLTWKTKH
ncbi:hypothetical protein [Lentilactobacillus buchneri]|uniref:hypothetical protein n=1 Tax=Lentilactobacillus buchneri TaxID=1581 RepID=UPI000309875E|nr:hypothetical protein [Lentilactobacillus buchneri]WCJ52331.1 hypothetical protein OKF32_03055 [Lentilactobacillus sp. Egmn17]KRK67559.1 hypothetical protein FC79_GL001480 [Lentilactobacillus buchneri DSM 20057]MCT2881406.1 hypothetical protein [Lentilactobacillus buchneri]MCT2898879.1 hypothetical protein [Lentilactobacillus buchneri]MCT3253379.1 hypothetical protein [Lentilactobacillus buchneri]